MRELATLLRPCLVRLFFLLSLLCNTDGLAHAFKRLITLAEDEQVKQVLQRADLYQVASQPLKLNYGIFRGESALRYHGEELQSCLLSRHLSKTARASLLLLLGKGDAAHEVLLGVDLDNINSAEFAATHPGQTNWSARYPLSDTDDLLHSFVHLLEGSLIGEGNHTGWQNAKYWAAGGPKATERIDITNQHVILQAMTLHAVKHTPLACRKQVIVTSDTPQQHTIIASGQKKRRIVTVHKGCWDPFCFIDLVSEQCSELEREIRDLQCVLLEYILAYELFGDKRFRHEVLENETSLANELTDLSTC